LQKIYADVRLELVYDPEARAVDASIRPLGGIVRACPRSELHTTPPMLLQVPNAHGRYGADCISKAHDACDLDPPVCGGLRRTSPTFATWKNADNGRDPWFPHVETIWSMIEIQTREIVAFK
jgi:hypothetical protein